MPAAKFQIERKCELCGETFLAKTITSRYCSIQCSRSAYSQKKREEKLEELRREKAAKVSKDQPYLSISDAIALYDVCRDTLYRLVRSKALRSYNLGKRMTRICREDLERNFNLRPIDEQKPRTRSGAKLYNLEPEYCYTIGEITAKFGVTEGTVYKHIRKFSIPIRQIGNYVYAPKSEIDQLYK